MKFDYNKPFRVEEYTDILDPENPLLGPVSSGSIIQAVTPPGCWGPMITPELKSGHEVTKAVGIIGAEKGDSLCVIIEKINILSLASTSGVHRLNPENIFGKDPFVGKYCPVCKKVNPAAIVKSGDKLPIRCKTCGNPIASCLMESGYTMVFNKERTLGITIGEEWAQKIRDRAGDYSKLPEKSIQYSANLLATGDMSGFSARIRPLIGNIGTLPGCKVPSSHNSLDVAPRLLEDPHSSSLTREDIELLTDGHMDNNLVTEGTMLICPVMVRGGGIYLGDVHAMQSPGEIAGHTTDVAAEVIISVKLIKNLSIPGPLILPKVSDLPDLIKPWDEEEWNKAVELGLSTGVTINNPPVPIMVNGSGQDLNKAILCGLERLAKISGLPVPEVKNLVTISGTIGIGRVPGTVNVGFLIPQEKIKHKDLKQILVERYLSAGKKETKNG